MNVLTFIRLPCTLTAEITLISYMHTQHYACVDVLPEDTLDCMLYFTHHKHTGAHNFACIDIIRLILPMNA